ncbi:carbohydrate ABC transporter permease [Streptomyces aculeolatus]
MSDEGRAATKVAVPGKAAGTPVREKPRKAGFRSSPRYRTYLKYRFVTGFLIVPLGLYAVFVISPFIQTFYYSLTDWTGVSSDFNMVGFENYSRLLDDSTFWAAVRNNLILALAVPFVTLSLGLFFAFMVTVGGRHKKGEAISGVRGAKLYKIVYFFPQALSIAVIAALWGYIFKPDVGLLDPVLPESLSPNGGWLADSKFALWAVMIVMCWAMVGFFVVLFSAAIGQIPKEIYESALLDGASRAATFFRITLPLIRDSVQTGWVYMGIMALGAESFAVVNIITQGPGGPDDSTMVLGVYLWNTGFGQLQAGRGAAMGVALFILTMILAVAALSVGRRRDRIEY